MILTWSRRPGVGDAVDGRLHRVEGEREQAGQADDLRLELVDGGDELLDRHVDAEVVDVVAVDVEHEHHDVLADVVDVAGDGAEDDGAAVGDGGLALDARLELLGDALHDLAAHDELGDEDLLALELVAEDAHRALGLLEHVARVGAGVEHGRDQAHRLVLVHADDGVGELFRHALPPW